MQEIPAAVDVESDAELCGDTMGDSDCIEKELRQSFRIPFLWKEDCGDAGVCEIFQRK
ncbi:MAG: hypothetical protein ACLUKE_08280 [Blautia wexlerae]